MIFLLTASLLWAFSFGLIGHWLAGLPPCFLAWIRLGLSCLLFVPWAVGSGRMARRECGEWMLLGGIQYGLMYLFYMAAFVFLPSHRIALYTVLTPLYVTVLEDFKHRRLNGVYLLAALLAVGGAVLIKGGGTGGVSGNLSGFLLVQVSNLCFAFGQVHYRRLMSRRGGREADVFAWMYLGGVLVTSIPAVMDLAGGDIHLTGRQVAVLIYLGLVPSGIGFFLWNAGARRVNAGTLAVFNNVKIPLAVGVSVLAFGEMVHVPSLLAGLVVLTGAFWLTTGRFENGSKASWPTSGLPVADRSG